MSAWRVSGVTTIAAAAVLLMAACGGETTSPRPPPSSGTDGATVVPAATTEPETVPDEGKLPTTAADRHRGLFDGPPTLRAELEGAIANRLVAYGANRARRVTVVETTLFAALERLGGSTADQADGPVYVIPAEADVTVDGGPPRREPVVGTVLQLVVERDNPTTPRRRRQRRIWRPIAAWRRRASGNRLRRQRDRGHGA